MSANFRSSKLRAPPQNQPLFANGYQASRVRNLPAHGDIYVVDESLIYPSQQLCTTALQVNNGTIPSSPRCQNLLEESIRSSQAKAKYRGKR